MKKWLSFLLALCMLLSLTACGNESGGPSGNPSEPKSPTDVEVELTEPVTITFWHGIVQENMQQTLNEIVDDFNKGIGAEKGITVECRLQSQVGSGRVSVSCIANILFWYLLTSVISYT